MDPSAITAQPASRTRSLLAFGVIVSLAAGFGGCGASGESHQPSGTSSNPIRVSTVPSLGVVDDRQKLSELEGDDDDDDEGKSTVARVGDNDADFDDDRKDNAGKGYYDRDDSAARFYGRPASANEERAIAGVVRGYYAAAARADGGGACSLIYPPLEESIPEDYGQLSGPSYMRGQTCPLVMSRFFRHIHQQLMAVRMVTDVRVRRKEAYVLLGSKTMSASYVVMKQAQGAWKVDALIGSPLP